MLINNEENGFVCELGNVPLWSSKIVNILENQAVADSMREKGQQLIRQRYTWEKLAPKFISEYQKLL